MIHHYLPWAVDMKQKQGVLGLGRRMKNGSLEQCKQTKENEQDKTDGRRHFAMKTCHISQVRSKITSMGEDSWQDGVGLGYTIITIIETVQH